MAQCFEPKTAGTDNPHIRTVAFATKKEITDRLIFPDEPYFFEWKGNQHILAQVTEMGYKFKLCHSDQTSKSYQHWTSFLDWMWDCDLLGSWKEYWNVYEEQFNPIQRWENIKTKTSTLLTEAQCEKLSNKPNVTALIVTSDLPISNFVQCVLSLLVNSTDILDRLIVAIAGNGITQRKKEDFLERLSAVSKIPLTVIKTTDALKYGRALDQLIPCVETECYLVIHDTMMVANPTWENEATLFLNNEKAIVQVLGHVSNTLEDGESLKLPALNTSFTLCKKSLIRDLGATWTDYDVPLKFNIGNLVNFKEFTKCHMVSRRNPPLEERTYDSLKIGVGSFVFQKIRESDYEITRFTEVARERDELAIIALENRLQQFPDLCRLYQDYRRR